MIVMDKMKFGPVPADLHKGDSIVWVNRDFLRHTATAADHSFNVDLVAGAKGKITVTKSGTIPFACRYHPGMRGVLQVK
jgi:plastocyanin